MAEPDSSEFFKGENADRYDERFDKLAPLKDALHLLTRLVLQDLPADARILCVGAGTGAEIFYLAELFPGWRFLAVDPSSDMLEKLERKAQSAGLSERIDVHEGFLESAPDTAPFDAATSLLVSQFILDREKRLGFFEEIAARLRPGGHLVAADLCTDLNAPAGEAMLDIWTAAFRLAGEGEEMVARFRDSLRANVAVVVPEAVRALIAEGGFADPLQIYQGGLIHAWAARKAG